MKRLAVTSTIVLLVAVIGWQQFQVNKMRQQLSLVEQQREEEAANDRKAALEKLQRLPSDHRKMDCASHIGKLKGSKHDAALLRFRPFFDDNYTMTEEDLKTCEEF